VLSHTSLAGAVISTGPDTVQPFLSSSAEAALGEVGVKLQRLQAAQWNLDRIDQRSVPLDQQYRFGTEETPGTGRGVTIFSVDSGVRASHQEFDEGGGRGERRKSRVADGYACPTSLLAFWKCYSLWRLEQSMLPPTPLAG
jgi:subtilisin family serine protease